MLVNNIIPSKSGGGNNFIEFTDNVQDFQLSTSTSSTSLQKLYGYSNILRFSKNVKLTNNFTIIPEAMFYQSDIESIIIPNTVTSIGKNAFCACKNLKKITIPDSVIEIGESLFSSCSNLEEFVISNNITNITSQMFTYCTNLKSVTIPNNITSINVYAFRGCENLLEIIIPNNVTNIYFMLFNDCNNLIKITLPGSFTRKTYTTTAEETYPPIKYLTIANGSTTITTSPKTLLNFTSTLEEVYIPNTVLSIENEAFKDCKKLKKVIIPRSIENIKYYSFANCYNLENIYYEGTEEEWNKITKGTNWNGSMGSNIEGGTVIHYNYTP